MEPRVGSNPSSRMSGREWDESRTAAVERARAQERGDPTPRLAPGQDNPADWLPQPTALHSSAEFHPPPFPLHSVLSSIPPLRHCYLAHLSCEHPPFPTMPPTLLRRAVDARGRTASALGPGLPSTTTLL